MEGHVPLPTCSICLAPVENPTFTRCVHLACAECMLTWMQAAPIVDQGAREQQARQQLALLNYTGGNEADRARLIAREKCAPCMLCRQPFSISQLIRVDPEEAKASNELAKNGGNKTSKSSTHDEDEEDEEDEDDSEQNVSFNPLALVAEFEPPRHTRRLDKETLADIPSAKTRYIGRDPTLPGLNALFLTQMNIATGIPANVPPKITSKTHRSPKMRALLRLLKPVMKTNGGTGKAVVFSQMKNAVSHAAAVLKEEKIGFVKIIRGDPPKSQTEAVQKWNVDPECHIFLLHAGTAAAGLTLTAAQHVFLMEPFNSVGEELQAMNRTHRIGQKQECICTTLFMRNSIEERILAYREVMKNKNDDDTNGNNGGSGSSSADFTVLSTENTSLAASNDHQLEFILGLSEP